MTMTKGSKLLLNIEGELLNAEVIATMPKGSNFGFEKLREDFVQVKLLETSNVRPGRTFSGTVFVLPVASLAERISA